MPRVFFVGVLIVVSPSAAMAEIWGINSPLHHALVTDHDEKTIVAGKIGDVSSRREFEFQVGDVILGAPSLAGQTLTIRNGMSWSKTLVPCQKGASCVLVLHVSRVRGDYGVRSVVAGRDRDYAQAADEQAARPILAEELLHQLQVEKTPLRQRELLLQVGPILSKEDAKSVERFEASSDPWVRRAALAALVYATEDPKYLNLAARDLNSFLSDTRGKTSVDGPGSMRHVTPPKSLLLNDYFFLNPRSWTWGSVWNEREGERHLRNLDAILKCEIVEKSNQQTLFGDIPHRDDAGTLQIIEP